MRNVAATLRLLGLESAVPLDRDYFHNVFAGLIIYADLA